MAVNLLRNTKVFFTTRLTSSGAVDTSTPFVATDTFELQVLDGFTFSQNTTTEIVTLNEAGATPNRGQRAFNTALEPVEFSFSTYLRPKLDTNVICEESVLWSAFATGRGGSDAWTAGNPSTLSFANSEAHQLKSFGMIMLVDGITYLVDNCALDQATIDFGLDALATVAWTGRGTAIRQVTGITYDAVTGAFTDTVGATAWDTSIARTKYSDAKYIANKLSVVNIKSGINDTTSMLDLPITGGSITFANNLTYLTPANLGIVNTPVTYFTGTRAISGSLTAYLRAGATTGNVLNTLLTNASTEIAPAYTTRIQIGGSTGTYVQILLPAAMLSIPTINAEQVVTTTMNFVAHANTAGAYDIEAANEATISYYAAA